MPPKPKPLSVDEIAAKYKRVRLQCYVCSLGEAKADVVHQLRHSFGLSYQEIATAITREYGRPIADGAVRQHFLNHVRTAA